MRFTACLKNRVGIEGEDVLTCDDGPLRDSRSERGAQGCALFLLMRCRTWIARPAGCRIRALTRPFVAVPVARPAVWKSEALLAGRRKLAVVPDRLRRWRAAQSAAEPRHDLIMVTTRCERVASLRPERRATRAAAYHPDRRRPLGRVTFAAQSSRAAGTAAQRHPNYRLSLSHRAAPSGARMSSTLSLSAPNCARRGGVVTDNKRMGLQSLEPAAGKVEQQHGAAVSRPRHQPSTTGRADADGLTPEIAAQVTGAQRILSARHVFALQRAVGDTAVGLDLGGLGFSGGGIPDELSRWLSAHDLDAETPDRLPIAAAPQRA